MSVRKGISVLIIGVAIVFIVKYPTEANQAVHQVVHWIVVAADSLVNFVNTIAA